LKTDQGTMTLTEFVGDHWASLPIKKNFTTCLVRLNLVAVAQLADRVGKRDTKVWAFPWTRSRTIRNGKGRIEKSRQTPKPASDCWPIPIWRFEAFDMLPPKHISPMGRTPRIVRQSFPCLHHRPDKKLSCAMTYPRLSSQLCRGSCARSTALHISAGQGVWRLPGKLECRATFSTIILRHSVSTMDGLRRNARRISKASAAIPADDYPKL